MRVIRKVNGSPVSYSITKLKSDNPNVSFPRELSDELLAQYDVYRVRPANKPQYDEATENVVEGDPVETSPGVWGQNWLIVAKTDAEIDDYQFEAARANAIEAIKQDQEVIQLLKANPGQIDNFIDNNVTNMAEAKDVLKRIARAVSVLAQGLLR